MGFLNNFPEGNVLASIADLQALTLTRLPAVTGDTIISVASYYDGGLTGGGLFRYNSAADATGYRANFLVVTDSSGRKWERIIGSEGLDASMAGAVADGAISGSGVVTGVTNNTDAINALLAVARDGANRHADIQDIARISISPGVYRCNGTVDMTGIGGTRWELDCRGACIASRAAGLIAVDCSDSYGLYMNRLTIHGDPTAKPAVGFILSRTEGVTGDCLFNRLSIIGEFTYAAFLNDGAENVRMIQPFISNYSMGGTAYAIAADSRCVVRYDPPVTGATATGDGTKITVTKTSHGLSTGNYFYPFSSTHANDIQQRWPITVINANSFSFLKTGISGAVTIERYHKARFWSTFILDANDTRQPYVGEGAFTFIVDGGQAQAPYGKAAVLDTPGGRRKWNIRLTGGVYEAPSPVTDITVSGIVSGTDTITTATAHGLVAEDWAFYDWGGDEKVVRISSVPLTTTAVITHIDGSNLDTSGYGSGGGTIRKLVKDGGYGIHFIGDIFETPIFENIHMEEGPAGDAVIRGAKAVMYIQSLDGLLLGTPSPVYFKGARFREHTMNTIKGAFDVDTATVSSVLWTGSVTVADFSTKFGNGLKTNKLFLSPSLWTVSGDLFLDVTTTLSDSVTFTGTVYDTTLGTLRKYPGARRIKESGTTSIILNDAETLITNTGAVAGVTYTLPDAISGLTFEFMAMEAFAITLRAVNNDSFTMGTTTGLSAGSLTSSGVQFTSVIIRAGSSRRWVVVGGNNTSAWTVA